MRSRVVAMVEGAVAAALGAILSMIILYRLPQGGSVTLAAVVPIWVVALRRGPFVGALAGVALGLINFLQNPQAIHPLQPIVDYPLAFGLLGLAGIRQENPIFGAITAVMAKFSCHVLSGVLFFGIYVPAGQNPLHYSLVYNLSVVLPDLVVALVVFSVLRVRAPHLFLVQQQEMGRKSKKANPKVGPNKRTN